MDIALLDLLCPPLVPVVQADVTAGTPGDVHLALIDVSTIGATPDEFAALVPNDLNFLTLVGDVKADVVVPIHPSLPFQVGNCQEVFLRFLPLGCKLLHPNSDWMKRVDTLRGVHDKRGIANKRDM